MTTIHDAVFRWEKLWAQGCKALGRYPSGKSEEALQLLLGALLYQRWAIMALDEANFHGLVRENPAGSEMADLAAGKAGYVLSDQSHLGATMHLASASIRLPLALSLAAETNPGSIAAFDGLFARGNEEPWPRDRACRYLEGAKRLGHCSPGLGEPLALVIVLLARDEFGHGEEGSGHKHWRRERNEVMTTLHRCRIVDAQQMLAEWAFNAL